MATLEDVVYVLAKHAKVSGSPDDEAILSEYMEEEDKAKQQAAEAAAKPAATGKEGANA